MPKEQAPANQKKGKQQQQRHASVEDESNSNGEGRSGDSSGEQLVPAGNKQPITPVEYPQIPGFSEEQTNSLIHLFNNMLSSAFERHFPILANQHDQAPPSPTPAPPTLFLDNNKNIYKSIFIIKAIILKIYLNYNILYI